MACCSFSLRSVLVCAGCNDKRVLCTMVLYYILRTPYYILYYCCKLYYYVDVFALDNTADVDVFALDNTAAVLNTHIIRN